MFNAGDYVLAWSEKGWVYGRIVEAYPMDHMQRRTLSDRCYLVDINEKRAVYHSSCVRVRQDRYGHALLKRSVNQNI